MDLPEFKAAATVFIYMASGNEPNTAEIIKRAFELKKRVFVSVTKDKIRFSEIFENTVFVPRKYGILEPESPVFCDTAADIIIVPMVAYDRDKGRLGHGMGYYDRFLRDAKGVKIGLAYSALEADSVFTGEFDIPMDIIINEREIIR